MTEIPNTAVESAPLPDSGKRTPGEYLRKRREEKGLSHAAVGSALHLTVHYIKALESDDYGKLPGLTFVKGYLRAYARFLGADVDSVLARFDEHITGLLDAGMHTARVERSRRRQDQALRWAIGAGFVVVAGLVAGWWFLSDSQEPVATAQRAAPAQQTPPAPTPAMAPTVSATPRSTTPLAVTITPPVASTTLPPTALAAAGQAPNQSNPLQGGAEVTGTLAPQGTTVTPPTMPGTVTPATLAPVESTTATISATPESDSPAESEVPIVTPAANGARQVSLISSGEDELRVSFIGKSWIEVDDGSMVRLYNDMLSAGDTLTIRGEAPFYVLLGDASQVEVSVNAAAVDISADIRDDSTARLVLGAPAASEVAL